MQKGEHQCRLKFYSNGVLVDLLFDILFNLVTHVGYLVIKKELIRNLQEVYTLFINIHIKIVSEVEGSCLLGTNSATFASMPARYPSLW